MTQGSSFRSNDRAARGDLIQNAFNENTLTATRVGQKSNIIFRPLPMLDASGNPLPMVLGQGPQGPIFSAIHFEDMMVNGGLKSKYTGSVKCVDQPNLQDADIPWTGLYIRLKGALKQARLQGPALSVLGPMLTKKEGKEGKGGGTDIPRADGYAFLQGIFLSIDGAQQAPAGRRVLAMGPMTVNAIGACMKEAAAAGIDLFDPQTGWALSITPLLADKSKGRMIDLIEVKPAYQLPLPTNMDWKSWLMPWDGVFRRSTYDQHIARMLDCFEEPIIAEAFPGDVERVRNRRPVTFASQQYGGIPQQAYQQPPYGGAPQGNPMAPPYGYPGQPAPQQPTAPPYGYPGQPSTQPPAAPAWNQQPQAPQQQQQPAAPAWNQQPQAPAAPAAPAWPQQAPAAPPAAQGFYSPPAMAPAAPGWPQQPAAPAVAPAAPAWPQQQPQAPQGATGWPQPTAPAAAPAAPVPGAWAGAQAAPAAPAAAPAQPGFGLPNATELARQYEQMLTPPGQPHA